MPKEVKEEIAREDEITGSTVPSYFVDVPPISEETKRKVEMLTPQDIRRLESLGILPRGSNKRKTFYESKNSSYKGKNR